MPRAGHRARRRGARGRPDDGRKLGLLRGAAASWRAADPRQRVPRARGPRRGRTVRACYSAARPSWSGSMRSGQRSTAWRGRCRAPRAAGYVDAPRSRRRAVGRHGRAGPRTEPRDALPVRRTNDEEQLRDHRVEAAALEGPTRGGGRRRPPRRADGVSPCDHEVVPARWRTLDQPGASTATEETAHGVDAPAGDVLAKRPDWQAWRWVWERGRHGPARGL